MFYKKFCNEEEYLISNQLSNQIPEAIIKKLSKFNQKTYQNYHAPSLNVDNGFFIYLKFFLIFFLVFLKNHNCCWLSKF